MNRANRVALLSLLIAVLLGWGMAWAGSQHGVRLFGQPLFALLIALIFLIQWLVFLPSYWARSEKFFDLTGSLTYIAVTLFAVLGSPAIDGRTILLMLVVVIWAARLGLFLFTRVRQSGKDGRFDDLKTSFLRFLNVWTLQGVWITFTASAALAAITTTVRQPLGLIAWCGLLIWLVGFAIEVVADNQKKRFKSDPANKGQFIQHGLWARSRHPNYFGEIVLWIGVALIALPVLRDWQWVTLSSPLFVMLLLTRISGVPLLEKRADEKWGGDPAYEAYKKRTPQLVPRLHK